MPRVFSRGPELCPATSQRIHVTATSTQVRTGIGPSAGLSTRGLAGPQDILDTRSKADLRRAVDERAGAQPDVGLHQHVGHSAGIWDRGVRHVRRNIQDVTRLKFERLAPLDGASVLTRPRDAPILDLAADRYSPAAGNDEVD